MYRRLHARRQQEKMHQGPLPIAGEMESPVIMIPFEKEEDRDQFRRLHEIAKITSEYGISGHILLWEEEERRGLIQMEALYPVSKGVRNPDDQLMRLYNNLINHDIGITELSADDLGVNSLGRVRFRKIGHLYKIDDGRHDSMKTPYDRERRDRKQREAAFQRFETLSFLIEVAIDQDWDVPRLSELFIESATDLPQDRILRNRYSEALGFLDSFLEGITE